MENINFISVGSQWRELNACVHSIPLWENTCVPVTNDMPFWRFLLYLWWELPQVKKNSGQKFSCNKCDKHMFVTTKHVFCHDKSMFAMTKPYSRQNYVCFDKIMFVFVATKIYVCCDKTSTFVLWQTCVCCDKHVFVVTKLLSWQEWFLWQELPQV